jgi:uncharacterized protein (TIGR02117 family)
VLKKLILAFVILFSVLVIPTFIPLGEHRPSSDVTIYLISNSIHTDLVVPVKNEIFDWEQFYDPADFKARSTQWLQVGWGDREFYTKVPTWNEFTIGIALDALFLPGPGAMHINYLDDHPEAYKNVRKINISTETYKKLISAIKDSFVLKNGRPVLLKGKGYFDSDNFYDAHGKFSMMRTCNVWTSDILAKADLPHPLWSPSKIGIEFIWGF